jgi:nucleotide-binding universal stress UspA family protein
MLIPLDGSKLSEQVLPYARSLAQKVNLPVELLALVDDVALAALLPPQEKKNAESLIAESVRGSVAFLERIRTTFHEVPVSCTVEKGMPGEAIIKKAAADGRTLIAMATHGRSRIDRWLLGSVAEKVMRGTSNPLLLVRTGEGVESAGEAVLESIIVPLDGSPLAEKALPHAMALATAMNLELLLLRAYSLTQILSISNRFLSAIQGEAAGYLDGKKQELKHAGVVNVSSLVSEGDAAQQITELASRTANSLVVICSHGRSGIGRWVLGSVAERVLRHSVGPVLLVRPG